MDWYASDNKLCETPRCSRKKPNADRPPTWRLWSAATNLHVPCNAHAALCRGLEKSLSERHGNAMSRARHGMACVNQTRPHCVNKMGKTQSNPLAARHGQGMGMAWYVWISLKLLVYVPSTLIFETSALCSQSIRISYERLHKQQLFSSTAKRFVFVVEMQCDFCEVVN
jgi:hypothetical protein